MAKRGLYANINARKKKGISRSKKKSTITDKAYANMKAGFPKVNHRKLLDFSKGPGSQGSEAHKLVHCHDPEVPGPLWNS